MRAGLVLALVGCTSSFAAGGVEETTHHRLPVAAGATVIVEDDGGAVEVLPGRDGAIEIDARRRAASREEALALPVTVEVDRDGRSARIRFHEEHHLDGHSVSFTIRAPGGARLQISTGGGAITTRHMGGQVLRSGGGAISVREGDGTIEARTGGGSVEVSGRLRGASRVTTGGGSVHVAIPGDSRLHVDASTGGGSAESEFGLTVDGRGARRMSGTLGDGSEGSLELRTGGGSLQLSRL
jgi:hypothetical protein